MWGAIEGFQNTSGWNGINSLPREISLSGKSGLETAGSRKNLRHYVKVIWLVLRILTHQKRNAGIRN
ncbi:MAG: hypothetical protein ACLS61_01185 [Ruminococcus sp.]